jgi:hypothetical protein
MTTELLKVQKIEEAGGNVHKIPFGNLLANAKQIAQEDPNGFFINQFGNSEQALLLYHSDIWEFAITFFGKYLFDGNKLINKK